MSRTNQPTDTLRNPAQMFLEWKSKEKTWSYWDKDAQERRSIPFDTPFMVLDQLSTITGYSKPKKSGFWSNEVRSIKDRLVINWKDGIFAEGIWADLKGKDRGLKFAASVYAYAKIDGEPKLVNFKMSGCALTAWIEFRNSLDGERVDGDLAIHVADRVFNDEGIPYTAPVFGVVTREISDEARDIANEMDKELQAYLDKRLADSPQARAVAEHSEKMQAYEEPPPPPPNTPDIPDDEPPF